MGSSPFRFVLVGIMVLLDFYVFQVVRVLAQSASPKTRSIIFISYWVVSIIALLLLIILPYLNFESYPKGSGVMVLFDADCTLKTLLPAPIETNNILFGVVIESKKLSSSLKRSS